MTTDSRHAFDSNRGRATQIQTTPVIRAGEDVMACASQVVPKEYRPNAFMSFMLAQAGGYDAQYYTAAEAKKAAELAAAKFLSVGMATFAFMKAVHPAFDAEMFAALPKIGGVIDPKYLAMAGTAGMMAWAVSKLDTSVIHLMRARKAADMSVLRHKDVVDNGSRTPNKWGLAFRIGISTASLGITLPALLVTVSETTIDQHIRDRLNTENAQILTQQQGRLADLDANIARLRKQLADLQGTLVTLQNPQGVMNDTQRQRIEALNAQLQDGVRKKAEQDAQMAELEKKRDEAQARMRQEEMGTRGSVAGKKSKYMAAQADYEDTLRSMETMGKTMGRRVAEENAAKVELEKINADIARATQDGRQDLNDNKANINRQIEDVRADLQRQLTVRESLADIEGQAARDPKYKKFRPDLAEKVSAYVQYMRNDANALEWSRAAFMSLMIVCLELGVFAMAAGRPVSEGELRGYLASALKSREAMDAYKQVMANLDDAADTKAWDRKKKRIEMSDMVMFEEVLADVEKDPALRARTQREILQGLESLRPAGAGPLTSATAAGPQEGSRRTYPVYGNPAPRATLN